MNRVALDLGIIQIYWYSLMIFLGVLVACIFIFRETRKQNINEDFMLNLIFYSVVFWFNWCKSILCSIQLVLLFYSFTGDFRSLEWWTGYSWRNICWSSMDYLLYEKV